MWGTDQEAQPLKHVLQFLNSVYFPKPLINTMEQE